MGPIGSRLSGQQRWIGTTIVDPLTPKWAATAVVVAPPPGHGEDVLQFFPALRPASHVNALSLPFLRASANHNLLRASNLPPPRLHLDHACLAASPATLTASAPEVTACFQHALSIRFLSKCILPLARPLGVPYCVKMCCSICSSLQSSS